MVRMFTDGACSCNPGPGGYAAVINLPKRNVIVSGYEENTTNNRMELMAVIKGMNKVLEMIYQGMSIKKLEIISDSAYVINAINKNWLTSWKETNFRNAKGENIKNVDLWSKLEEQVIIFEFIKIELCFTKVKGHNGNYFNEMADEIAKNEIVKNEVK